MTDKSEVNHMNKGVFYSPKSYAGFWVRVFAWIIDVTVLCVLLGGYFFIYIYFSQESDWQFNTLTFLSLCTCFVYLTIVKTSKYSTLGFWLNKIKVVDLYGKKPHFLKMALRFILLTIGPFELFLDLLWLTGEKTKQTLRDKYVGTYVVTRNSEPIGEASIVQNRLHVLGWNLILSEVDIPEDIK